MTLGMCRCLILLALAIDITLSLPTKQTPNSFYNQEMGIPHIQKSPHRYRRQAGFQNWQIDPNRQVWINNAFQIPIMTLQAISNLLQSTRPLVGTRPMATMNAASTSQYQQYPSYQQNTYNQQYPYHQQNSQNPKRKARKRPTKGAQVTGLDKIAEDGSSFKI